MPALNSRIAARSSRIVPPTDRQHVGRVGAGRGPQNTGRNSCVCQCLEQQHRRELARCTTVGFDYSPATSQNQGLRKSGHQPARSSGGPGLHAAPAGDGHCVDFTLGNVDRDRCVRPTGIHDECRSQFRAAMFTEPGSRTPAIVCQRFDIDRDRGRSRTCASQAVRTDHRALHRTSPRQFRESPRGNQLVGGQPPHGVRKRLIRWPCTAPSQVAVHRAGSGIVEVHSRATGACSVSISGPVASLAAFAKDGRRVERSVVRESPLPAHSTRTSSPKRARRTCRG